MKRRYNGVTGILFGMDIDMGKFGFFTCQIYFTICQIFMRNGAISCITTVGFLSDIIVGEDLIF